MIILYLMSAQILSWLASATLAVSGWLVGMSGALVEKIESELKPEQQ